MKDQNPAGLNLLAPCLSEAGPENLESPTSMALLFVAYVTSLLDLLFSLNMAILAEILCSWHLQLLGFPLFLWLHSHRFMYCSFQGFFTSL